MRLTEAPRPGSGEPRIIPSRASARLAPGTGVAEHLGALASRDLAAVSHLLLMRHAKSSWSDESLDDHDRPLDPRGERAASLMGAFLGQRDEAVDLVLCSTAVRARQTLERVARLVALPEPTFERGLYLASGGELLGRLRRLPAEMASVLLIGHNPGLAELAESIAGRGPSEDLDLLARKFPTGALAILEIGRGGWSGLRPGSASLEHFILPKHLV